MFTSYSKCAHKSFKTNKRRTQKIFYEHEHYIQDDHEVKDDWQIYIDHCTINADLRKRELYWQHLLKTFFPNGLNECKESGLYNKLARQKISGFILSLVKYYYYYYYYYYHYYFYHYCHYYYRLIVVIVIIITAFVL